MQLDHPYLVSLGIPLLLLFCGALAKKLVRGGGWKSSDFFLGVEIALSALGSAMLYFYDLQKNATAGITTYQGKLAPAASFIVISFFLLLAILSIHQDWEGRNQNPVGQFILLGIGCNAIGVVLFATFATIIKGV